LILVAHTSLLGFPYEPPVVVTNPSLISFQFYRDKNLNVINDYAAQPDAYPPFLEMGVQSCAFLPVGFQGYFFGLIYIISKEINHFTPERIQLLSTIRDSLSVLFENADLYEKISEDLTQRRTAQAALAESEARFRTLAENTADIVWEMDPEGATPIAAQMLSRLPATVPGSWSGVPNTISCSRTRRKGSAPFFQTWYLEGKTFP